MCPAWAVLMWVSAVFTRRKTKSRKKSARKPNANRRGAETDASTQDRTVTTHMYMYTFNKTTACKCQSTSYVRPSGDPWCSASSELWMKAMSDSMDFAQFSTSPSALSAW